MGKRGEWIQNFDPGILSERHHFEGIDMDGIITCKWVFEKLSFK
jgi:hypothetical protein